MNHSWRAVVSVGPGGGTPADVHQEQNKNIYKEAEDHGNPLVARVLSSSSLSPSQDTSPRDPGCSPRTCSWINVLRKGSKRPQAKWFAITWYVKYRRGKCATSNHVSLWIKCHKFWKRDRMQPTFSCDNRFFFDFYKNY